MTILLQEIKDFLTKSAIPFNVIGDDITFPISTYFITVEDGIVYFVNESEEAKELDSVDALLKSFCLYKITYGKGFFIVRKSKDSVHASNSKMLLKDKSLKKILAKIEASLVVEKPVIKEHVHDNTFDAPVVMPKLERKVPQRKPRKAKVIKEKSSAHKEKNDIADGKPVVKKRKVSSGGKSIKTVVLEMITSDAEDISIVEHIRLNFPDSKFDINHVSWYRSTWFRDGIIEPKHAPRRSKVYKAWLRDSQKENATAPQ